MEFLWPGVALVAVLFASALGWRVVRLMEMRASGGGELVRLQARLSEYPPAQELVDQLDELRQNFAELQDKALGFVSEEHLDRLLTRDGAEKIVANVNAMARDLAEVKTQFDHILSIDSVREVFGIED